MSWEQFLLGWSLRYLRQHRIHTQRHVYRIGIYHMIIWRDSSPLSRAQLLEDCVGIKRMEMCICYT